MQLACPDGAKLEGRSRCPTMDAGAKRKVPREVYSNNGIGPLHLQGEEADDAFIKGALRCICSKKALGIPMDE